MDTALRSPATAELLDRVEAEVARLGLRATGTRVLVGASGGADSTALAVLLARLDPPLTLALGHVDHGWRPGAADRAAVEVLGARLGVPVLTAPAPSKPMPTTEAHARRHRYRALDRLAERFEVDVVAVGHHAGDQAETFLMRLLRGSGPVGLAGMPIERTFGSAGRRLVRPLLGQHPRALRSMLEHAHIGWQEDPTNADVSRDRARIRARLRAHTEAPIDRLARLSDRLRTRLTHRAASIENGARHALQTYPLPGAVSIDRSWLAGLARPLDLQLALRLAGTRCGTRPRDVWLTRRHIAVIGDVLDGPRGALDLPEGLHLHVGGSRVWLVERELANPTLPALSVANVPTGSRPRVDQTFEAVLDAAVLGPAPRLRRLRPDDRFVPHGGSGRFVPVLRWLQKQGMPRFGRRRLLVLEGDNGIAWVAGARIDARHAITPATRQAVRVRLGETD